MKVEIRGHSDDIVSVEGDITDEFYDSILVFDSGDVVSWTYGAKGVWRCEILSSSGTLQFTHEHAPEDDASNYSDTLTVEGDFKLIDAFGSYPPERVDIIERITEYNMLDDLDDTELMRVYNMTQQAQARRRSR